MGTAGAIGRSYLSSISGFRARKWKATHSYLASPFDARGALRWGCLWCISTQCTAMPSGVARESCFASGLPPCTRPKSKPTSPIAQRSSGPFNRVRCANLQRYCTAIRHRAPLLPVVAYMPPLPSTPCGGAVLRPGPSFRGSCCGCLVLLGVLFSVLFKTSHTSQHPGFAFRFKSPYCKRS